MAPIITEAVTISSSSSQGIMKTEHAQIPTPHHNGQSPLPVMPNFIMGSRSPGPGGNITPTNMPNSPVQMQSSVRNQTPSSHVDMSMQPMVPNTHILNDSRAPIPNAQYPGDRISYPGQPGLPAQSGPNMMMPPGMTNSINDQTPLEKFKAKVKK